MIRGQTSTYGQLGCWLSCSPRLIESFQRWFLVLICLLSCQHVVAQTYDLETDFDYCNNTETSIWSFRYQADGIPNNLMRDGRYELLPNRVAHPCDYSNCGLRGFCDGSGANGTAQLPFVAKNALPFPSCIVTYRPGTIPPGAVVVSPDAGQLVVIRWLAPKAGTVQVEFQFQDAETMPAIAGGVLWFVDLGDASGNLAGGPLDSGPQVVSNLVVQAGHQVHFIVDPNGGLFDTTRVQATITYLANQTGSDQISDVAHEFPLAQNGASGRWSCCYQANGQPNNRVRDGEYEFLTQPVTGPFGYGGLRGWARAVGSLPLAGYNAASSNITSSSGLLVPPGQVLLHPGPDQLVAMAWRAPQSGVGQLKFRFWDMDPGGGDGILWFVDRRGVSNSLAAGGFANGGQSGEQTLPFLNVREGEEIYFIVDPGADYTYDSTGLEASFEYTAPLQLHLRLGSPAIGSDLEVTWPLAGTETMCLQQTADVAGPWLTVPPSQYALTGGELLTNTFKASLGGNKGFFRIASADSSRMVAALTGHLDALSFDAGLSSIPFSMVIGGRDVQDWMRGATVTRTEETLDGQRTLIKLVWRDVAGLELTCEVVRYSDFEAVEWVLLLKNSALTNSALIEEVLPLDLACGASGNTPFTLHAANGGVQRESAFQPLDSVLKVGSRVILTASDGRSSGGHLPYFNLEAAGTGLICAIGWSGQWRCECGQTASNRVHLTAGMERTHFRLLPGEGVRSPRILSLAYTGGALHGHHLFRRFMYRHVMPPVPANAPLPHAQMNTGFFLDSYSNDLNTTNLTALFNAYQPLGVSYVIVDAGWNGAGWWTAAGTWTPRPDTLPGGMWPLAQTAALLGLRLGMWFEPERAVPGTDLFRQHPEWLLTAPGYAWTLLNLSLPEARDWYVNLADSYITSLNLGYFKHDYNMDPSLFWWANDTTERAGVMEMHCVEGLYQVYDELLRRHPDILYEGCASGGRRMDFEMLRRCHLYLKSDDWFNSTGQQAHIHGGSLYIPATYLMVPLKDTNSNPYAFRCTIGGLLSAAWNTSQLAVDANLPHQRVSRYQELCHLFSGDFYPLTPHGLSEASWIGWQFHRDDLNEGVAVLFRRQYAAPSLGWQLQGLDPGTTYELTDEDSGLVTVGTGQELSQPRIMTLSEPMSAALLTYRKKP